MRCPAHSIDTIRSRWGSDRRGPHEPEIPLDESRPPSPNAAPPLARLVLRFALVYGVLTFGLVAGLLATSGGGAAAGKVAVTLLPLIYGPLLLLGAFKLLWQPMVAAHPPVEPAEDAVRRRFQSFGLGIVNMGFSIHVAADEKFLHLTPILPLRFFGAVPCSIPWSALEPIRRGTRPVRSARLRPGRYTLTGPRWCMELVG